MAYRSRHSRQSFDIWPGFVDALSGLLIIILIVTMVFMTAQFFLGEVLSGRDRTITRLTAQITALARELSIEKEKTQKAEKTVTDLAAELRASLAARDSLVKEKLALDKVITNLRASLTTSEKKVGELTTVIGALRVDKQGITVKLKTLEAEKAALLIRIAKLEEESSRLALRLAEALTVSKSAAKSTSALVTKNKSLEEKVSELARKITALEVDNAKLAASLAAAVSSGKTLEGKTKLLEGARAKLAARIAALAKRIAELEDSNQLLSQRLAEALKAGTATKAQITEGNKKLSEAEKEKAALAKRVAELEKLNDQLRTSLSAALRDKTLLGKTAASVKKAQENLLARLAKIEKERDDLLRVLAAAQLTQQDLKKKLGAAEAKIDNQHKLSETQTRQLTLLNAQIAALRRQLLIIQTALEASEDKIKSQNIKIKGLGDRLAVALATKVEELKKYKSEFFGRLRETLSSRKDIKIVGDRFVFPAEVLFPSGSDRLNPSGRKEMAKVAKTLKEITSKIPKDIDWVLRIDGHTDVRPVRGKFKSNWQLSAARAIAVVNFMVEEGIPANRLFAAGFGEFHPIVKGKNRKAYAKNRRIELKITQR